MKIEISYDDTTHLLEVREDGKVTRSEVIETISGEFGRTTVKLEATHQPTPDTTALAGPTGMVLKSFSSDKHPLGWPTLCPPMPSS